VTEPAPNPAYDYSAYNTAPKAGSNSMEVVQQLAEEQLTAEAKVAGIEESLKEANGKLAEIAEHKLPTAIDAAGLKGKFVLDRKIHGEDYEIEVKDNVFASIPAERRPEAFDWLIANDLGGLIKHTVEFDVGKNEELFKKIVEAVKAIDPLIEAIPGKRVEGSTLRATVARMLREGKSVPMELFGVFEKREAKVKVYKPKSKRAK